MRKGEETKEGKIMEQKIIEEVGKNEGRVKMKAKGLAKLQYCKRKINERMTT